MQPAASNANFFRSVLFLDYYLFYIVSFDFSLIFNRIHYYMIKKKLHTLLLIHFVDTTTKRKEIKKKTKKRDEYIDLTAFDSGRLPYHTSFVKILTPNKLYSQNKVRKC